MNPQGWSKTQKASINTMVAMQRAADSENLDDMPKNSSKQVDPSPEEIYE